ncbi:hypothetical protein ACHAXR_010507, partial [Thalassiosira sp. AJA248-18]
TKQSLELKLALVRNEFLDKPPTKIVVLGELYSGDEYAWGVMRDAFGSDMTILHDHVYRHGILDQSEVNAIAERTDILWVMAVRSPCDWADAVIRFQKESCEKHELPSEQCTIHQFATETDYYRIPWYDVHNGNGDQTDSGNIIESHPDQKSQYDDIFDLRQQKLMIMKQVMDALPRHVKTLRLREFELNPDVFVKDLVKEYQFKLSSKYKPRRLNANPENSSLSSIPQSIFSCLEYAKWKEAQQKINWTLEGYFGYHHLDCHLCRDSGQATNNGLPISSPSNLYILGERNSGTTFVSNTLGLAFDPPNAMGSKLEKFSTDIPVLLHKHMFRHDLLDKKELAEIKARDDILWIMVVRSPCDWAEGMFRKPYHLCPPKHPEKCGPGSDFHKDKIWMNQNTVAGISLLDFFTKMEWKDWAESVPFLRDKTDEGSEEVSISKVSANYTYPNVFRLRQHKLKIMKQIMETVPRNVKFVRLKELERSPEMLIQSVVREFNLTVKEGYKPQPASPVTHPTVCLTPDEWDAVQNSIDWKLEAEFGFSPCDCRMCYGYEKSKRLYTRIREDKKNNKIVNKKGHEKASGKKGKQDKEGKDNNKLKKQEGEGKNDQEGNASRQALEESTNSSEGNGQMSIRNKRPKNNGNEKVSKQAKEVISEASAESQRRWKDKGKKG